MIGGGGGGGEVVVLTVSSGAGGGVGTAVAVLYLTVGGCCVVQWNPGFAQGWAHECRLRLRHMVIIVIYGNGIFVTFAKVIAQGYVHFISFLFNRQYAGAHAPETCPCHSRSINRMEIAHEQVPDNLLHSFLLDRHIVVVFHAIWLQSTIDVDGVSIGEIHIHPLFSLSSRLVD